MIEKLLRLQAWERAKGELRFLEASAWILPDTANSHEAISAHDLASSRFASEIDRFIKTVEDNGWYR